MQCVDARNQIALLVGDDLDSTSRSAVEEHLSSCESCRQYQQSMVEARTALESVRALDSEGDTSESLWPAIRSEIESGAVRTVPGQTVKNRFVAALAIAATLLAAVWISKDLMVSSQYDDSSGNGAMAAPVNYPSSNGPRRLTTERNADDADQKERQKATELR